MFYSQLNLCGLFVTKSLSVNVSIHKIGPKEIGTSFSLVHSLLFSVYILHVLCEVLALVRFVSLPQCLHVTFLLCIYSIGIYRGWWPVVTSICVSNFVYFYVFTGLKAFAYKGGVKPYPAKDLLLAFCAGMFGYHLIDYTWFAFALKHSLHLLWSFLLDKVAVGCQMCYQDPL